MCTTISTTILLTIFHTVNNFNKIIYIYTMVNYIYYNYILLYNHKYNVEIEDAFMESFINYSYSIKQYGHFHN